MCKTIPNAAKKNRKGKKDLTLTGTEIFHSSYCTLQYIECLDGELDLESGQLLGQVKAFLVSQPPPPAVEEDSDDGSAPSPLQLDPGTVKEEPPEVEQGDPEYFPSCVKMPKKAGR